MGESLAFRQIDSTLIRQLAALENSRSALLHGA
jgi:hypothetical protein